MNKAEILKDLKVKYEKDVEFFKTLPDKAFEVFDSIHYKNFFSRVTVDSLKQELSRFRKHFGNYELKNYFMSYGLNAAYTFEGLDGCVVILTFPPGESEEALELISGGKCKLVKSETVEVSCEILP